MCLRGVHEFFSWELACCPQKGIICHGSADPFCAWR
jgi:hypothetical protein